MIPWTCITFYPLNWTRFHSQNTFIRLLKKFHREKEKTSSSLPLKEVVQLVLNLLHATCLLIYQTWESTILRHAQETHPRPLKKLYRKDKSTKCQFFYATKENARFALDFLRLTIRLSTRFTDELSSNRKHRWIYLAKKAHTAIFESPQPFLRNRVLPSNGPRNYNDQLTSD